MAYKKVTLICPDCGVEFVGTTERKVQRDFPCAMRYWQEWSVLSHSMQGMSLPDIRKVARYVKGLRA